MRGLVGFLGQFDSGQIPKTATATAERIAYRGPDDFGVWVDAEAGIALAHRRLSVVDHSPDWNQPVLLQPGGLELDFNYEINRHRDLRGRLARNVREHASCTEGSHHRSRVALMSQAGLQEQG